MEAPYSRRANAPPRSGGANGAEARPVLAWRRPGVTAEQLAEERDVLVADRLADVLDGPVRTLEVTAGGVDPQAVEIPEGPLAGGGLEPAGEVARAHPHLRRQRVELHRLAKMGDEPL